MRQAQSSLLTRNPPWADIRAAIGPCEQTQHFRSAVPVVDVDGVDDRASLIETSYFTDLKGIQIVRVGDEEEDLRAQGERAAQGPYVIRVSLRTHGRQQRVDAGQRRG